MIRLPSRIFWLLGLALVVPTLLGAQIPIPGRGRIQPQTRRDTSGARRDTTGRDSLKVRFSEPDSVMSALMNQPGSTVTRYEGQKVTFDAITRAFRIQADSGRLAVVQRGPQTVIADTSIVYEEATKTVSARGHVILSDPTSGQEDIKSCCIVTYNLEERSALIRNPKFAIDNGGVIWYLGAGTSKVVGGDSTNARNSTFYARGGTITSCDDSIPDYHFEYGEFKKTAGGTIVGRPAVLYIRDVPVMWLPFFFQDARSGRRSGIVTPQFGIADFIRNSPNYRRRVEDLGYYFAINDYMDARVAVDWLSSSGAQENDLPGNVKLKGEWSYNWFSRFLRGHIASDYTRFRTGDNNLAISWNHSQEFSRDARVTADLNYVKNTTLQRQNSINPYTALATIRSALTYSNKIGPATLQLGGTRTQYPGRTQIEQTLPNLSITSAPISAGSWLVWTPNLSYTLNQTLHMDQSVPLPFTFFTGPSGTLDSTRVNAHRSNSTLSFQTPLRIFGYDLRNSFTVNDERENFPKLFEIRDVETGEVVDRRVFAQNYTTLVDWTPDFQLPPVLRSLFNITPSVSLQNIESGPFWVRSSITNGQWVHQGKRPTFSVSAAPAIFGLFPGVGPFERFRHTMQPTLSYSYAPAATVSNDYLRALNRSAAGNLSGFRQNALSLGLNQFIEAKVRSRLDTNPDASEKIKLISLQVSPLTYDFERAHQTGKAIRGLTNDAFSYTLTTDLIPNFDVSMNYSLFEGVASQDSARFKPFRTGVSARLSLTDKQNPFAVFTRLFGRAVPAAAPTIEPQPSQRTDEQLERQISSQPVAGSQTGGRQFLQPPTEGWTASFTFSSSRQRPPGGNATNVIFNDPRSQCAQFEGLPAVFDRCIEQASLTPSGDSSAVSAISGGTIVVNPPVTSVGASTSFRLTQKWSASWQTSYDVERHQFASQIVSLQRDLHDWRATFGFTQSPNGNFAFTFFIALKAQPDLKFDYNRATYRGGRNF